MEELASFGEDDDDGADRRAELVKRYATVRPFLPMLTTVVPFGATDAGASILAAARSLPELAARKRVRPGEVDRGVTALVFAEPDLCPREYASLGIRNLASNLQAERIYLRGWPR